jgi:hypothetical protein
VKVRYTKKMVMPLSTDGFRTRLDWRVRVQVGISLGVGEDVSAGVWSASEVGGHVAALLGVGESIRVGVCLDVGDGVDAGFLLGVGSEPMVAGYEGNAVRIESGVAEAQVVELTEVAAPVTVD